MKMEENKKLYTLLVYSENVAGILNQITAVFTRRQVNIEIVKITRQIEKKIDVIKANYFTDDQLFIRETGLYKLATDIVLQNSDISRIVRHYDAQMTEVNPTYVIVMKSGRTEDIISLYYALNEFGCVLQYTRSGRIAVTRGTQEQVTGFLEQREKSRVTE